jgi:hypothetical protein
MAGAWVSATAANQRRQNKGDPRQSVNSDIDGGSAAAALRISLGRQAGEPKVTPLAASFMTIIMTAHMANTATSGTPVMTFMRRGLRLHHGAIAPAHLAG